MLGEDKTNTVAQDLIRTFIRFSRLRLSEGKSKFMGGDPVCQDIKHSEMMTLFAIKEIEGRYPNGVSVSDLSAFVGVKPPTLTPIIGNLEREGMITRSMDAEDRRIIRIRLVERGNTFIQHAAAHFISHIQGLVDYLGEEKSINLTSLMSDVFQYFDKLPSHEK